ncbi:MAG: hypothetical protein RL427_867 [Bacteroidota bacterium]|jgi:hypothetical protein
MVFCLNHHGDFDNTIGRVEPFNRLFEINKHFCLNEDMPTLPIGLKPNKKEPRRKIYSFPLGSKLS